MFSFVLGAYSSKEGGRSVLSSRNVFLLFLRLVSAYRSRWMPHPPARTLMNGARRATKRSSLAILCVALGATVSATFLRRCQRALVFTPCARDTPTNQTSYGADRSLFEAVNLMLRSNIRCGSPRYPIWLLRKRNFPCTESPSWGGAEGAVWDERVGCRGRPALVATATAAAAPRRALRT